jgi:hypothetical protein
MQTAESSAAPAIGQMAHSPVANEQAIKLRNKKKTNDGKQPSSLDLRMVLLRELTMSKTPSPQLKQRASLGPVPS